jgi:hypothetical protein
LKNRWYKVLVKRRMRSSVTSLPAPTSESIDRGNNDEMFVFDDFAWEDDMNQLF